MHGKSIIDGMQLFPRPTALLWMGALYTHGGQEKYEHVLDATHVSIARQFWILIIPFLSYSYYRTEGMICIRIKDY